MGAEVSPLTAFGAWRAKSTEPATALGLQIRFKTDEARTKWTDHGLFDLAVQPKEVAKSAGPFGMGH